MLQDGIPFGWNDTSKGFDFSSSQFTVQAAATAQMKVAWEVSGMEQAEQESSGIKKTRTR
ncbi:hypothetical protein [Oryza sativa Japonica Group]|uniref:Uncharacterized protein n=1 Tax=Oryza sativa subsp. japonica TaxID=39947 RepID=Q5NB42_ORYSJ|nr:hypothetical protein [Oryza sativa Japonica Group]